MYIGALQELELIQIFDAVIRLDELTVYTGFRLLGFRLSGLRFRLLHSFDAVRCAYISYM